MECEVTKTFLYISLISSTIYLLFLSYQIFVTVIPFIKSRNGGVFKISEFVPELKKAAKEDNSYKSHLDTVGKFVFIVFFILIMAPFSPCSLQRGL